MTSTTEGKDRRKSDRISKKYRMEVSEFAFPLTEMRPFGVTGIDISEGGLSVQCSKPFVQGQKVQVKVFIPRLNKYHPGFLKVFENDLGQYINVVAEVAWVKTDPLSDDYTLGLEFVDIYEDDLHALHNLIRSSQE